MKKFIVYFDFKSVIVMSSYLRMMYNNMCNSEY